MIAGGGKYAAAFSHQGQSCGRGCLPKPFAVSINVVQKKR